MSAAAKRRKRVTLPRSLPASPHLHLYKRHAKNVGEIAMAWNQLDAGLLHLFSILLYGKIGHPHAMAIWHSIVSDSGRRDVLRALAGAACPKPKILADIYWLLDRVKDVGAIRNAFVHTSVAFQTALTPSGQVGKTALAPHPLAAMPRVKQKNFLVGDDNTLFRMTRGDIVSLASYCDVIYLALNFDLQFGRLPRLSRRPVLQAHEYYHSAGAQKPRVRTGKRTQR